MEPIRWSLSDPLEPLIFRLLGLNADISAPHPPDITDLPGRTR